MTIEADLAPGTYVVAVSGGVDSMALLDMLVKKAKRPGARYRLIVGHFDHGVREDSSLDRQLVQEIARRHGLVFVHDEGHLGPGVSENVARKARYAFLRRVRQASAADAIVTAHHQDDLVETAILNMLRGTNRRGLGSLRSHSDLWRPVLHIPKSDLIKYAKDNQLIWHEDSTNDDMRYLRNYVRAKLLPRFSAIERTELLKHIFRTHALNESIEAELARYLDLHPEPHKLNRKWFIQLPHSVAREVLSAWLRRHHVKNLSAKMLERLVAAAKTYAPGGRADVDRDHVLWMTKDSLALLGRERYPTDK